ncbi:MAG TPA: DUF1080 domain-containing protein [Opitutaceae bacterium]|nr:DUF1080 domain-containing protein [Opitutaceae bacterium]
MSRWIKTALLLTSSFAVLGSFASSFAATSSTDQDWIPLFNGKNLDGFYTFLPSKGVNSDPEGMFKAENGMIHIFDIPVTDQKHEFGYICTEKSYKNYRLRFQYKWGQKKFAPRDKARRDSGCLYHMTGPDKVWPRSIECQVMENDTGDVFVVGGNLSVTTKVESLDPKDKVFSPLGTSATLTSNNARVVRNPQADTLDDWNTVEIVVRENTAVHTVNGQTNNRLTDIRFIDTNQPLSEGKILFQAEGAEVFYRNIEIKPLNP